ncbi:MAG TPA: S41 family peptidase [Bacteroidales bacterium]|nr:S41 family peptidase [Bacteroidales bacterium]
MIRSYLKIILICFLNLTIVSCEKCLLEKDPQNTPINNFDYLWTEVKHKYAYFEYKRTNWDSIYDVYSVDIQSEMADTALFNVLADMLYELNDGHVNLKSDFDRSRNWSWFLEFPQNFNLNMVTRNYLGNDYKITGPLKNQVIDSVLYIYYGSFGSEIQDEHIDYIIDRTKGLKGLIIDIRDNGGGSLQNGIRLASAFTDTGFVYARSRIKTGPAEDDFAPWEDLEITPRDGDRYTGKIVLLTNKYSYSASTFFAQMMKSHPRAVLIGDHTGGGGGIPAYGELPNGWIYRFSSTQTLNPHDEHIEGGVMVDIRVDLDPEDEAEGIDTILEVALEYLRG